TRFGSNFHSALASSLGRASARTSVEQPCGDVAIGLLEIGKAANVEPVLADEMGGHHVATVHERPDHVGAVEVLAGGDQVDDSGIDYINARVDLELLARLLLHACHSTVVKGELAVGNVDLVERHAHGHGRGGRAAMELPHGAEVA